MAELVPICKDRATGNSRPFEDGDTLVDEAGNIIQGGGGLGGSATTGTRTLIIDKTLTAGLTDPSAGTLGTDLDVLDFASGVNESQKFEFTVPQDYDSGNLVVNVQYAMNGTSGGTVDFALVGENAEIGDAVNALTFTPSTTALAVVNTANVPDELLFATIPAANVSIGDRIRVQFERQGTTDSNTDTFHLLGFTVNYTGAIGTGGIFSDIADLVANTDETPATPTTIGTDIEVLSYTFGTDAEQKIQTVVPDEWDGTTDVVLKIAYAMSTAVAASVVRIETAGEIADVSGGTITAIGAEFVEIATPSTTLNTRVSVRVLPASLFTKGSPVVLKIARRNTGLTGTNHTGDLQVLSYELSFNTDSASAAAIPTGTVTQTARITAPTGWLMCDGSEVSRTIYSSLFAAIGTTYGVGDGSTSFNLPDTRGKTPVGTNNSGLPNGTNGSFSTRDEGNTGGEENHTLTSGEMPNHGHGVNDSGHQHTFSATVYQTTSQSAGTNALLMGGDNASSPTPSGGGLATIGQSSISNQTTGISINSAGGGGAHNNMQPFVVFNYIIKT